MFRISRIGASVTVCSSFLRSRGQAAQVRNESF
jgi:hypothetical protein